MEPRVVSGYTNPARRCTVLDAVRGYVQLAGGLAEVGIAKARDVVGSLLSGDIEQVVPTKEAAAGAARAVSTQMQELADDLASQATANRELLTGLIRTEVDRTAGRVGFVREEELAAVRRHVARLESQLSEVRAGLAEVNGDRSATTPAKKPVKRAAKTPTPAPPEESTAAATAEADAEAESETS
jgi:hypothetical protein